MLKAITLTSLFLFYTLIGWSQAPITGDVLDSETGQPVPFVNIGIKELGMGTVSNSNGQYQLKYKSGKYLVIFSSIGYEVQNIPISQLLENSNIKLKPKTEILDEVVINADKYGSEVILGSKLDSKGHSIGFGSRSLGTEIAAHIKVKSETTLKSAHFTINFTGADSLLFRVNIYDFQNGEVGEKLLKENVIITAPQQKGTFDVDFKRYNLIVSEDILLSLEWVQDDNGTGNEGLMFRSKKGGKTNLYTKRTSFAKFEKLSDQFSMAPKLRIGFYLQGVEK